MNAREQAIAIITFARRMTEQLLEDIPEEQLLHQPVSAGNHALWVMGHLATTDDALAGLYDGGQPVLPQSYNELFGMGSKPTHDAGAYPPIAEVREHLGATRKRLLDGASAADDAALSVALPEELEGFAPDRVGLLISLAWHEGLHAGQITMVRRSLGIGPKMG
ncbi:MAG TPA: DinB family protein [Phycisphaerae bacterium]|nr:DinB family protein [Phycisphaerae bacterium]